MLSESIAKLVQYGIETGLTPECERNYTTNLLLECFHEDEYTAPEKVDDEICLEETLRNCWMRQLQEGSSRTVLYIGIFLTPS
jgi:galactose-1-phosphate uridylyltransferase